MNPQNPLDDLPGELMMWILIVSEFLVFGAGLTAFLAVRLTDPAGFAEAQDHLFRTGAALNTAVLITSGFLAAQALAWRRASKRGCARVALVLAAAYGVLFLAIKGAEYACRQKLKKRLWSSDAGAIFLPVDLPIIENLACEPESVPSVPVELRLANRGYLRFDSAMDAAALTRLIRAVEEA